ncbi:hypothetical protein ACM55F_03880 [Flavobacterium sp. XS2P12]|uniref:hypothetical protein n=1 Tax=Flavobacterium melibiosi TaxID=3398734 RepID=UPI003A87A118
MNRKYIILFLLIFSLSCEKRNSVLEFEQNVFDQIFLNVVDLTYKDKRLYTLFPEVSPKLLYDKDGKWIGRDTTGQYQREVDCELKREILKKDTLNLIIAIDNEGLISMKTDLKKYSNNKFIFKHFSELPKIEEYQNWGVKYPKFAGVMSFSRIQFNHKKENGVLNVSYSCGGKCGLGYSVYIKKNNKKWIVYKVKQTWIS